MRTIRFRGKRLLDNKFVYGSLVQCLDGSVGIFNGDDFEHNKIVAVKKSTIDQFTGLTDKNSKEIYEGDIIRSTRNGFGGVVMWHKRGYFYIRENIFEDDPDYNGDYANLGYMLENHPYFEVVGNISDNTPERLKGGEQ